MVNNRGSLPCRMKSAYPRSKASRESSYWRSSFLHHNDFVDFSRRRAPLAPSAVPRFYAEVGRTRTAGPILEFPWPTAWWGQHLPYRYQLVHGQEVVISTPEDFASDPRQRFRNLVGPQPEDFLRSRARYLVLHLDPVGEEERAAHGRRADARRWKKTARSTARRLQATWGPPLFADEDVRVWDLAGVDRPQ